MKIVRAKHPATKYHDLAMEFADSAFMLRIMKLNDKAQAVSHYASTLEAKAALHSDGYALTQSVLYRSAAWLAYHGDDSEKAIELAQLGLEVKDAPEEIREELREVLEVAEGG